MRKHIAAWELLAQYALSYCIDSRLPRTRAPISCNQATDNSAADAASSKGLTMTKGTSSCPGSVDHLILMVLACRFWHIHTYVRADVHTYHLCHTPSFFFTQHLSHTTLSHTFFFTTCLGFPCRLSARMTHTNRDDSSNIFTFAYMKYSCVNCEALRLRKNACPLAW